MAHFEVGKKVICIKDHSKKKVKKGQVFPLNGIKKFDCKCRAIVLDIGLPTEQKMKCGLCGSKKIETNGISWLHHSLFAPYDDSLSELTVEEILNEQFQTV